MEGWIEIPNTLQVTASVDTTGLNQESTQLAAKNLLTDIKGLVDGVETLLTSLDGKDYATQTTLAQAKTDLDNIYTKLQASIAVTQSGTWTISNSFNLEATQLLIKGVLDNIKSKTDNIDLASTALRDALIGTGNKTLTDIVTALASVPVTGTFWQATQPVSASSLPLPTGAATAANQQTNALTDAQLRATAVPVSGTVAVSNPTTNPETGLAKDATLTGGTQKTIVRGGQKGATNTNADITHTAEGADHEALDVQIYHGGVAKDPTAIRALTSVDQVTIVPSGTQDQNLKQVNGTTVDTNSGNKSAGTQRVVIATDQPNVPVILNAETTKVIGTVNQGTSPWITNDPGLPDTLGQKTMANSTGVVIASDQSAIPISGTVTTSTPNPAVNSSAPSRYYNAGANATANIKASAGNVFSVSCYNAEALNSRYIQLHNKASAASAGESPLFSFVIPAGGHTIIGNDFFTQWGAYFSTGITFAISTTRDTYTAGTAGNQSTTVMYI